MNLVMGPRDLREYRAGLRRVSRTRPPGRSGGAPQVEHGLEDGPDPVVGDPVVHVDAANAGAAEIARGRDPGLDRAPDVLDALPDDLDRAQADVQKGPRQLAAEGSEVAAPADIEKIEVGQGGEGVREPVGIGAAIMDAERTAAEAPGGVERLEEAPVVADRDHGQGAFRMEEDGPRQVPDEAVDRDRGRPGLPFDVRREPVDDRGEAAEETPDLAGPVDEVE